LSDTEFKPKPLTAAQRLKMNLYITLGVAVVLVGAVVLFQYHTDPVSSYATAPAASTPKL